MSPTMNWKPEEEAPEGWECVRELFYVKNQPCETWLDENGELILVPVKYKTCPYCHGTGIGYEDDEGDEEGCEECDGDGEDYEDPEFCFEIAYPKAITMKLQELDKKNLDVAGLEWWKKL